MNKKIILLSILLLSLLVFLNERPLVNAEGEMIYSLQDVVNITVQNNSMLKSLDYVIKIKQIDIQEKQDMASQVSDEEEMYLNGGKVKYYFPFDAKIKLEIAELDKEDQTKTVALSAKNAYLDVFFLQEAIRVLENGVKRVQEQVAIAKLNFELGTITKVDVLSSEVQLEKTKSELEQTINNLQIKKMQLNQVMNQSLTNNFNIADSQLNEEVLLNEDEISIGLENNISLKKQYLDLQSIDKLLEVIKMYYSENTYAYQTVYANKLTKQSLLDETKSKVEMGIRSQQIKINSLNEKEKVMKQQVSKVEETYNIMFQQYKAGIISYQDLANMDQQLKQTDLEALQAKLDYYRAIYDYKSMLGIE